MEIKHKQFGNFQNKNFFLPERMVFQEAGSTDPNWEKINARVDSRAATGEEVDPNELSDIGGIIEGGKDQITYLLEKFTD